MNRRSRITHEQIMTLINEVKKNPCLWNSTHETYGDVFHVAVAWKTIAGQLSLPENTVKTKWRHLRDTFYRLAFKRHAVSRKSGIWPYVDDMLYLLMAPTPADLDTHSEMDEVETGLEIEDVEDSDHVAFSDEYYDRLFLESLAPYFNRLDPVRRITMRAKIQDMLLKDISDQNRDIPILSPRELFDDFASTTGS